MHEYAHEHACIQTAARPSQVFVLWHLDANISMKILNFQPLDTPTLAYAADERMSLTIPASPECKPAFVMLQNREKHTSSRRA